MLDFLWSQGQKHHPTAGAADSSSRHPDTRRYSEINGNNNGKVYNIPFGTTHKISIAESRKKSTRYCGPLGNISRISLQYA